MKLTLQSINSAVRLYWHGLMFFPFALSAQSPGNFSTLTTTGNGTIGGTLSITRGYTETPGFGLDVWGSIGARGSLSITSDELPDLFPGETLSMIGGWGDLRITHLAEYVPESQGDFVANYCKFRSIGFGPSPGFNGTADYWQWIRETASPATSFVQAELTNGMFTLFPPQNLAQTKKIVFNTLQDTITIAGQPVLTSASLGALGNVQFSNTSNHAISIASAPTGTVGRDLFLDAGDAGSGTNIAGGSMRISAGDSKGSAGSMIELKTAAGGTSGTSTNVAVTRFKINASGGIEAGDNLTAGAAPQFVVGKYNDTDPIHAGGVFIIGAGSGTGATPRKNAMRVTNDGVILIPQQGDLLMGGFAGGEAP